MSIFEILDRIGQIDTGNLLSMALIVGVVLSSLIEITPIEICPLTPVSSLFQWIGKKLNGDLAAKMEGLQAQVNAVKKNVDTIQYDNAKRSALNYRSRILTFGDELRQGMRHSKESFDQIIEDIDSYQKYCSKHPEFVNNRAELTTRVILEAYEANLTENNFL